MKLYFLTVNHLEITILIPTLMPIVISITLLNDPCDSLNSRPLLLKDFYISLSYKQVIDN